jgi:hypothetical protein
MARTISPTLRKVPRRMRLSVIFGEGAFYQIQPGGASETFVKRLIVVAFNKPFWGNGQAAQRRK